MIYITGDTHGDWVSRLKTKVFPEQENMTKDDYVIVCGDFGIWNGSDAENHNLDWLEEKPFTTLFISGNHENYDILDNLPVEEWHGGKVNFLRPSVIHLMRGQIFNIDGKTFFTFGGARSHDISYGILDPKDPMFRVKKGELDRNPYAMYRINHISWWEREMPSEDEMDEGMVNLVNAGNKVDYIITHSPCSSLLKILAPQGEGYKKDSLTEYLQVIHDNIQYTHWYFGHMHINIELDDGRATCLYKEIERLI